MEGADGKSFRGLIDPEVSAEGAGRDHVFVHLNYPHNRQPFPMRGFIRKDYGYIWNGWADSKTAFQNESMSGRAFAAMKKAAENNPAIAERVELYLHRVPQELYQYSDDPDALANVFNQKGHHTQGCYAQYWLLQHMRDTKDPQFEAYLAYLKSLPSEEARGLPHFEHMTTPPQD